MLSINDKKKNTKNIIMLINNKCISQKNINKPNNKNINDKNSPFPKSRIILQKNKTSKIILFNNNKLNDSKCS